MQQLKRHLKLCSHHGKVHLTQHTHSTLRSQAVCCNGKLIIVNKACRSSGYILFCFLSDVLRWARCCPSVVLCQWLGFFDVFLIETCLCINLMFLRKCTSSVTWNLPCWPALVFPCLVRMTTFGGLRFHLFLLKCEVILFPYSSVLWEGVGNRKNNPLRSFLVTAQGGNAKRLCS